MPQLDFWLSLAGMGAVTAGGMMLLQQRRAGKLFAAPDQRADVIGLPATTLLPGNGAKIQVQSADSLLQGLNLDGLCQSIRSKTGFTVVNFDNDCRPVLNKVMELVQLFPASESHHHANPGGLLVHLFETLNHALSARQGQILPKGAQPEDITKHQHRWTYAVFLASLLHDIGKPIADLKVMAYADVSGKAWLWSPLAGTLMDCGASRYTVEFRDKRDYVLHEKLPVSLLQNLVPQHALQWLSQDAGLLTELMAYLSRDRGKGAADKPISAIEEIVTRADQESVRHNLLQGSRIRYASAKSTPLIERIMAGLREMLRQGGHLPLNRKGAVGWVYEGEVWFVSKRLPDELRAFLMSNNEAQGFPGTDKNDRIFDTLQEYGAIVKNPMTQGAIWNVRIEQADGWAENMTVLRFPLAKLYADVSLYPSAMQGAVRILVKKETSTPAAKETTALNPTSEQEAAFLTEQVLTSLRKPDAVKAEELQQQTDPPAPEYIDDKTGDLLEALEVDPPSVSSDYDIPERPAEPAGPQFLDDSDTAAVEHAVLLAAKKEAVRVVPRKPIAEVLAPVVPATPKLTKIGRQLTKEPPELALQFMRWLQEGIANGKIGINHGKAQVHFGQVNHPAADNACKDTYMLLVSPLIFRAFADDTQSGDGMTVQRQFLKAGWHLSISPGNINVLRFLTSNGGTHNRVLSCVAIKNPEQFVNPVPPVNSVLTYSHELSISPAR
jgi:integrating conjugative element relaxase (TIGR03760 family)